MSNLGDFKRGLCTLANQVGGLDTVHQLTDFGVTYSKTAADAMAADATANTLIGWTNPFDFPVKIVGAKLLPTAVLTASDTNYATITLKTDDGAASTPAVAVTWTTQISSPGTANWAVGVDEIGVLTVANCVIPAGGNIWFNIAKAAAGVVVGISHYAIRLQRAE